MRWLVKTLLDGEPFEEVHCETAAETIADRRFTQ